MTQLANSIRGYAAEFGVIAAKGLCRIGPLLERIAADVSLPALARELFAIQAKEYALIEAELKVIDVKLMAWHRDNACSLDTPETAPGRRGLGIVSNQGGEHWPNDVSRLGRIAKLAFAEPNRQWCGYCRLNGNKASDRASARQRKM
jgi:hypothetical protein